MTPQMNLLTPEDLVQSQAPTQESSWSNFIILAVSVVLFMGAGLLSSSLQSVLILVAVVFVHELGHFAGMRLFKYTDVKMFFIPFFGAAVTGKNEVVEAWKSVVVLLLGPIPGIFIGIALGILNIFMPNPIMAEYATISIVLNAVNLLPILPLDGGRIANILIFSRIPLMEAIFRVVAYLMLIVISWSIQAWILLFVGVISLFGTGRVYKIGVISGALRPNFPPPPDGPIPPLTLDAAALMIPHLQYHFPNLGKVEYYRGVAQEVWQKTFVRSPGILATIGVIVLCVGSILVSVVGIVILKRPSAETVQAYQSAIDSSITAINAGDFITGERKAREATEMAGIDGRARAEGLYLTAEALKGQTRLREAEETARECVKLREKQWKPDPQLEESLILLSEIIRQSGNRNAEADAILERARKRQIYPPQTIK